MLRSTQSVLSLLLASCMTGHAYAGYTFTKIADTSDPGMDDFPDFAEVAINNSGVVVFTAEDAANNFDLYLSTNIATPLLNDMQLESPGIISDAGTVFVGLTDSGTTGIYNANTTSFLIDDGSSSYNEFSAPVVTASDIVGFIGDLPGSAAEVSSTPPLTVLEDTTGPLAGFQFPDINDSGVMSFVADTDAAGDQELYISTSGTPIDTAVNFFSAVINNSGTVAYTDSSSVKTNTGGTLVDTTTDLGGGTMYSSFDRLSINNAGDIAMMGGIGSSPAIYVRKSNGDIEEVINTGSSPTLDGNTILLVNMSRHSMNDAGQIVFWIYGFTPAFQLVEGVYLATPDTPPIIPGDTNLDGIVDITDNLLLMQFILGTASPTPDQITAGDMAADSELNAADLLIHTRTILGLI